MLRNDPSGCFSPSGTFLGCGTSSPLGTVGGGLRKFLSLRTKSIILKINSNSDAEVGGSKSDFSPRTIWVPSGNKTTSGQVEDVVVEELLVGFGLQAPSVEVG